MSLLPVVRRELRVATRRPATYWTRSLAGLIAAVATFGMVLAGFHGLLAVRSAGQSLFLTVSVVMYVFVLFEGVLLTADALSQERREGTLGLLFLTNLRGFDVVLGKMAICCTQPLSCLLAVLPIPALALFLGGVTLSDFVWTGLALVNTLFFASALGLLVSAAGRKAGSTLVIASLLVLCTALLGPLVQWSRAWLSAFNPMLIFSPGGAFLAALQNVQGGTSTGGFAFSLMVSHLTGWLFVIAASVLLARNWREQEGVRRRVGRRQHPAATPPPLRIKPLRPASASWLELNPLVWLSEKRNSSKVVVLTLIVVAFLTWLAGNFLVRLPTPFPLVIVVFVLHLLLKLITAGYACSSMVDDRRTGALEILLTTPMGAEAVLRGKLLALKRRLLWPTMTVCGIDLVALIAGGMEFPFWGAVAWVLTLGIFIFLQFLDMYCLSWVGLQFGLRANNTNSALRKTVFYVLMLPWFCFLVSGALWGIITVGMGSGMQKEFVPLAAIWFISLVLMCRIGIAAWAATALKDELRDEAARQPAPSGKPKRWKLLRLKAAT